MIANARLTMFGANIWLIVAALLFGAFALVVLYAAWTGIRVMRFRKQQRDAELAYRRKRYDPDGKALVPTARGICDVCGQVDSNVYHLPDGRRLCRSDYARLTGTPLADA